MRTKRKIDYGAISRRSMRLEMKDDSLPMREKITRNTAKTKEITTDRIIYVGEGSSYFKYRFFLLGKAVRVVGESCIGAKKYEFVKDEDRINLNNAAGWSDLKHEYIFDNVKLKHGSENKR